MKEYTKRISEYIGKMPENELIEANSLHHEKFSEIPEAAFYKAMERFCKNNRLVHLTNGLYYKPKESRFGQVPISDKEIARYYMRSGKGIIIGYRLYNEKGITTQVSKTIEVLSNAIKSKRKTAGNVKIQKMDMQFTSENIPIVEALEILQNYGKIQDVNIKGLTSYMTDFATKYSDDIAEEVLQKRKYKKSTIAFMKEFLDYQKVSNGLEKHLSKLSNYAIPNVEKLYKAQ